MFFLVLSLFISYKQRCTVPNAMAVFLERAPAPPSDNCFQNRSHELPATLFHPSAASKSYYLVEGPHGCGKTTMIRDACSHAGPGVAYFSVPFEPLDFGIKLASMIGFEFYEDATVGSVMMSFFRETPAMRPATNKDATNRALEVIWPAAAELKKLLGHPPVMVIDDTARLARKEPEVLERLHDFAKDRADDGTLVVCWGAVMFFCVVSIVLPVVLCSVYVWRVVSHNRL